MTIDELKDVLAKHLKWLRNEKDGKRADLRSADLRSANLSGADLRGADLRGANLSGAFLCGAFLRSADLRGANLSGADLSGAFLRSADLSGADLRGADLSGANLSGADLSGADLPIELVNKFYPICCPEEGSFIGWKKAHDYIAKLRIEADAKRSSAFGRKCRCSAATCLAIENIDGTDSGLTEVRSDYSADFVYRVGETINVDDFDENRTHECAPGIHFFVTRQEAVDYDG